MHKLMLLHTDKVERLTGHELNLVVLFALDLWDEIVIDIGRHELQRFALMGGNRQLVGDPVDAAMIFDRKTFGYWAGATSAAQAATEVLPYIDELVKAESGYTALIRVQNGQEVSAYGDTWMEACGRAVVIARYGRGGLILEGCVS